jgi:hypothetical protein
MRSTAVVAGTITITAAIIFKMMMATSIDGSPERC